MKYRNIVIALGFVVIVAPFLGIPQSWRDIVSIAAAVLVVALAYVSDMGRISHTS